MEHTPETERIMEINRRHVVRPYQIFDTYKTADVLEIERGSGSTVVDTDGNEYIDAVGGLWCTNIGLGRDEMADAIAAQVRKLAYASPFTDMGTVPAGELAQKLADISPGHLNRVFFTTGGSTAVDAAFRTIQYFHNVRGNPQKRHIISRVDAYHGSTYASVSIGGKASDHPDEFNFIGDIIHHLSSPNFYRYGGERTEQEFADDLVAEFETLVAKLGGADQVAGFFAEPIMGAGGVIPPPADYLQRVRELCRQWEILYVSDEVVTAFGRLGHWFASDSVFNLKPDMITSAKGLTSGYLPLGALLMTDEVFETISAEGHGRYFAMGFTYGGHPVSCAAALKNIEIIEREDILAHVRIVGPYFMEQLGTLADLPMVGDVRGNHLMACLEFVADSETKRTYPDEIDVGKWVSDEAEALGLIVRPIVNQNVMSPPLVITTEEIDQVVSRLRESIIRAGKKLEDAGYT